MGVHLTPATKHRVLADYFDGMKIKEIAHRHELKRPSWVSVIVRRMAKPNRYRKRK